MTEGLGALLGCVQGQVSQFDSLDGSREHQPRLTERVALPVPPDGTHLVSLVCKRCQQTVRVHVRSLGGIRRKRLLTRLALAGSVCLWSAAAAFLLLYFVTSYPRAPGQEVALAGLLTAIGVALWIAVDGHDAFGGDVTVGCRVERSAEELAWARRASPDALRAMPRHVLLDADTAAESSWVRGETDAGPAWGRRKPA